MLLLLVIHNGFGQNEEEKKEIISQYKPSTIAAIKKNFESEYNNRSKRINKILEEKAALKYINNENGTFDELTDVLIDGSLIYYSLNNANAAISTRTNFLYTDGGLGLSLNGSNMIGGIWDGGPCRISHLEFNNRAIIGDGVTALNNNSFHATHVAGTVGAAGILPEAKGMAFNAIIKTFDWNNDLIEALEEAENGLLLSNHSYGIRINNVPDWFIGAYTQSARNWDVLSRAMPYYLMVTSAGNDGNNQNPNPLAPGLDKLTGNKNSKNNLVVANAQDALINPNGSLISAVINSTSSQGPTDDFRIKPDITGNGTGVLSTHSTSDESYLTLSGTSMSGPNVMGSLLLIQEHYNNVNARFMKSATLKGLACHLADDIGTPGPDPIYGWGLMNVKKMAETISDHGISCWITEEKLNPGEIFTFQVRSAQGLPLVASITWTDIPGEVSDGILNNSSPKLINDLDLRISQSDTLYFPWRLNPSNNFIAEKTGDNFVDNIEVVEVDSSNGDLYNIIVSHKGNLTDGPQEFSLIITGLNNTFAFLPQGYKPEVCASETIEKEIYFNTINDELVFIEAIDVPEGVNVTLSQDNINANGNFTVSISNLNVLIPGDHLINIRGSKGDEIQIIPIVFTVFNENISAPIVVYPNQGQTGLSVNTTISWASDVNAEEYTLQVATNPNFENLTLSETTMNTSFLVTGLSPTTVYYWRVIPSNRCGSNDTVNFNSFQTGNYICDIMYEASDYSDAVIEEIANASATVPIIVPNGFTIGDIKVVLNITHTWVQDLTISIQGPINSDALTIKLIDQACNGEDDIIAIFDDAGNDLSCGESPAISGVIIPIDALGAYNNTNAFGQWNLQVKDNYNEDGGVVDFFGLIFCMTSPTVNQLTLINNSLNTTLNSAETLQINHLQTASIFENSWINYTLLSLPEHGVLLKENTLLNIGDTFTQMDIINGNLVYENNVVAPTTDQFFFDVLTPDFSWLSSETFNINIESDSLHLEENTHEIFKVFPNPSNASINIILEKNDLPYKAAVYDLQGRLIYKTSLTHVENIINLEKYADGVYILELNNSQIRQSKKIVLQKTRP